MAGENSHMTGWDGMVGRLSNAASFKAFFRWRELGLLSLPGRYHPHNCFMGNEWNTASIDHSFEATDGASSTR